MSKMLRKAVRLYNGGSVRHQGGDVWTCAGDHGTYVVVRLGESAWRCNCPATAMPCSHILCVAATVATAQKVEADSCRRR